MAWEESWRAEKASRDGCLMSNSLRQEKAHSRTWSCGKRCPKTHMQGWRENSEIRCEVVPWELILEGTKEVFGPQHSPGGVSGAQTLTSWKYPTVGSRNQQSSVGTSEETVIRGLQSHLNPINAQLRPSAQWKIQPLNSLENKHDFKVLELISSGSQWRNSTETQPEHLAWTTTGQLQQNHCSRILNNLTTTERPGCPAL